MLPHAMPHATWAIASQQRRIITLQQLPPITLSYL